MNPQGFYHQKLIRRLREMNVLPQTGPVRLADVSRGKNGNRWRWYAYNPNSGTGYRVGSPHPVIDLARAAELGFRRDSRGITVTITRTAEPRESKRSKFRRYPCECGARPGEYCIVRGRPNEGTIHVDRVRKYHREHG